jgi:hypothetical protein
MPELDLMNLARSVTVNELNWFGQMITVNFAMIVAIYYFLSQARITLKVFSFILYSLGILVFFCEMVIEGNVKFAVLASLRALPPAHVSPVTQAYLAINASWFHIMTAVIFNSSFWLLWLGVFYLLFFGKRHFAR